MARRTNRWWPAAGVSIAIHLLVLLLARGAARERPARPVEIEIEIVELPPARAAEPPAEESAPAQPATPPPERGPPSRLPAAAAAPSSPPPARAAEAGRGPDNQVDAGAAQTLESEIAVSRPPGDATAQPPGDPTAQPSGDATEGARDPAASALPPGDGAKLDPTARRLELLPDRYDLAGGPGPDEEPPSKPAPPTVQERVDGFIADDRASARATIHVDNYFSELRRNLERRWDVGAESLRDTPGRGLGLGVRDAWDGHMEQTAAYGKTGNPYGDGPFVLGGRELRDGARPLGSPQPFLNENPDNGAYKKSRNALVLVEQDAEGHFIEVKLQRGSGSAAFDRAALEHARALSSFDLGLPPEAHRTIISFEATLLTTPPAPVVGCTFDAYFIPQDCFYPLSQRMKRAVRLVGIWRQGETPGIH